MRGKFDLSRAEAASLNPCIGFAIRDETLEHVIAGLGILGDTENEMREHPFAVHLLCRVMQAALEFEVERHEEADGG